MEFWNNVGSVQILLGDIPVFLGQSFFGGGRNIKELYPITVKPIRDDRTILSTIHLDGSSATSFGDRLCLLLRWCVRALDNEVFCKRRPSLR